MKKQFVFRLLPEAKYAKCGTNRMQQRKVRMEWASALFETTKSERTKSEKVTQRTAAEGEGST